MRRAAAGSAGFRVRLPAAAYPKAGYTPQPTGRQSRAGGDGGIVQVILQGALFLRGYASTAQWQLHVIFHGGCFRVNGLAQDG